MSLKKDGKPNVVSSLWHFGSCLATVIWKEMRNELLKIDSSKIYYVSTHGSVANLRCEVGTGEKLAFPVL